GPRSGGLERIALQLLKPAVAIRLSMTKILGDTARAKTANPGLRRILGIGLLRTPGLVAAQLPNRSAILAVWIVGGLYTLLGSVCLTELGTMLPRAGGYYVYTRRAFGDTVGFAVGWT